MNEPIMLTPGTLRVSPRVFAASHTMQLHHRSPQIEAAFAVIRTNLRVILKLPDYWSLVFFPTTGRGGIEALMSAVCASFQTMVLSNGRWAANMAASVESKVRVIGLDVEVPIHVAAVDGVLPYWQPNLTFAPSARQKVEDVVAFVSHETERGLLNPTAELLKLINSRGMFSVVDITSSVVIEPLDWVALGATALCFSASKGLRSLRDIGIVAIDRTFAQRLQRVGGYLNFRAEFDRQRGHLPTTPFSTSAVLALAEATCELLEEGVSNRRQSIIANMQIIHDWIDNRQDRLTRITDPAHTGWCTLPLRLPEGWTYKTFRAELLVRGFDIFYSHEGETGNTIEISTMGYLSEKDIRDFIRAVDYILKPVDPNDCPF